MFVFVFEVLACFFFASSSCANTFDSRDLQTPTSIQTIHHIGILYTHVCMNVSVASSTSQYFKFFFLLCSPHQTKTKEKNYLLILLYLISFVGLLRLDSIRKIWLCRQQTYMCDSDNTQHTQTHTDRETFLTNMQSQSTGRSCCMHSFTCRCFFYCCYLSSILLLLLFRAYDSIWTHNFGVVQTVPKERQQTCKMANVLCSRTRSIWYK